MDFAETKRRLRCFHPANFKHVHRCLLLKRLSPCPAYVIFCLVGDEVFRPDQPRLGPTRIKESSSTTSFLSMTLLASAMVAWLLFTMPATSTILALVAFGRCKHPRLQPWVLASSTSSSPWPLSLDQVDRPSQVRQRPPVGPNRR